MADDVRRRLTYERYGRRGRAGDPEYDLKNSVRRGKEKLSDKARHKLLCALADLGEAGRQIGAAWRARELLRDVAKLSPDRTGKAAARDKVAKALEAFSSSAEPSGRPSRRSRPSPRPSQPGGPSSPAPCSPAIATPPLRASTASSNWHTGALSA
jgi:hypothetical protein